MATVATLGADGWPQVSEVWFLAEDDGIVAISLNSTRQKTKNLGANPACTLSSTWPTRIATSRSGERPR